MKPEDKFVDLIVRAHRIHHSVVAYDSVAPLRPLTRPPQLAIRRDEANHRDVNHTFASLDTDDTNPFVVKHVVATRTTVTKADESNAPIL